MKSEKTKVKLIKSQNRNYHIIIAEVAASFLLNSLTKLLFDRVSCKNVYLHDKQTKIHKTPKKRKKEREGEEANSDTTQK